MSKSYPRILALDPGTKKTGYAVFEGEKLLYHGVKVFTRRSSSRDNLRESRDFLERFILTVKPHMLAVEQMFFSRRTARTVLLNQLYRQMLYVGKRHRLDVRSYAPSTIKKFITGYGWARKEQVARVVAAHYPELRAYLGPDRRWKSLHHANMFDAVALGLLALHHHRHSLLSK